MSPAPRASGCSPRAGSRSIDLLTPDEWIAVGVTLDVAARAVLIGFPLAVAVALWLARGRTGRTLVDVTVHLPLALPPVVVGWLLLLLFGRHGVIGARLLAWFGVALPFTRTGAALACAAMTLPLMVRPMRQAFEAIDAGLLAAARSLGAGRLDRLVSVTLPLAWPGILAALVAGYAASLGEFGAVITFAASVPGQTQTIPLAIYAALQTPGGEAAVARLSIVSIGLAFVGLAVAGRVRGGRAPA